MLGLSHLDTKFGLKYAFNLNYYPQETVLKFNQSIMYKDIQGIKSFHTHNYRQVRKNLAPLKTGDILHNDISVIRQF